MNNRSDFDIVSDEEFERIFMSIIDSSRKDNTYKFAFARFLLDYSKNNSSAHVTFSVIAEYFLEYYWTQICKLKMRHAPQIKKKPRIVTIIENEFRKQYYPHTFNTMRWTEPKKIQKCIEQIRKECFHDVTWRFQKINVGNTITRIFFDYKIERDINSNEKYVNLDYGINLNSNAIKFFKRHNAILLKAVILEWAKFLEKVNVGLPKILTKCEGKTITSKQEKYRRMLNPFFKECFYCKKQFAGSGDAYVEHVLPFEYVAEDNIWNLTLVCKKCRLRKQGMLPPKTYIDELTQRNQFYRTRLPGLKISLDRLDQDFATLVNYHYQNAKSYGYETLKNFP